MGMIITRTWAMPNADTFQCKPIGEFVERYLIDSGISVDPFARNSRLCTYTNDLNPDTSSEYHMDCVDFLNMLAGDGVVVDLGILDPPYSVRQMKECYDSIGKRTSMEDSQGVGIYRDTRLAMNKLIKVGGVVLSFGWNSVGMGINMGYKIEEIMMVCHGGVHNDTICVAERKVVEQLGLGI
jgi:hypothetical protein